MVISAIAALAVAQATAPPQAKPAKPAVPVQAAPPKPAVTFALAKNLPGLRPLAFAAGPADGSVAMTLEDTSVRVFNAATRLTSKTLTGHPQPAYAIAWSADGAMIATGDESARIWIWDAKTGTRLREMRTHIRGIQNLSFNLPRTLLASTGRDDLIKLYDPGTGKELRTIPGKGANFFGATFSPRVSFFATGTVGEGARMYDQNGLAKAFFQNIDVAEVNDVAFNPAGSYLASGGRMGNTRLWDVKTMKGMGSFKGHGDWVMHCRFSPNGKYLATSSSDRTVRIFDVATFKSVAVLENQSPIGAPLVWTADGKWLLTTGYDDTLNIFSVTPAQGVAPVAPVKKKRRK